MYSTLSFLEEGQIQDKRLYLKIYHFLYVSKHTLVGSKKKIKKLVVIFLKKYTVSNIVSNNF